MTMTVLFAGVRVRELEPAVDWYRGIAVGPIEPVGDAGRKAKGVDPDGNSVDLIEVTS